MAPTPAAGIPGLLMTPAIYRWTLLRAKGLTRAAIARRARVPGSTVSRVLDNNYWSATAKGQAKRDHVRQVIAQLLALPVETLFPPSEPIRPPQEAKGKRRPGKTSAGRKTTAR